MRTIDLLEKVSAKYDITEHHHCFTTQQEAADKDVPGIEPSKAQVVKLDDEFYLFVLPEDRDIDFDMIKKQFGASQARLASDDEELELLPDCQPGSELPLGCIYDLITVIDRSLDAGDYIVFRSEERNTTIRMEMSEYERLTNPQIMSFSYPNK